MVVIWDKYMKGSGVMLSNGDLTAAISQRHSVIATMGKNSGKWYWEITCDGGNNIHTIRIGNQNVNLSDSWGGYDGGGYYTNGRTYGLTSIASGQSYGDGFGVGDVISVLLDMDNRKITFLKNGASQPEIDFLITGEYIYPLLARGSSSGSVVMTANFGATPFKYPIPEEYKPYDPIINKTLILSDGKYMKYENGWQTVTNSLPTLEELEEHGMEDMSALDRSSSDPYDSPLDELEGDFEVVAWTDDEDEKVLHVSALPVSQFVHVIEGVGLDGDFSGVTVTEEFDGTAENGTVRYLISDDKTSWYAWDNGDFEMVSSDSVETDGMTLDTINNLSASDWEKWTHDMFFIGIYLDEDMQNQTKAYVENIDIELSIPTKTPEIDDVKMYILNTTATINVEFAGSTVSGYVEDADSTRVQYRVILNDEHYFPKSGEFTSLAPSPLSINLTLPNEDVKIDENNTLKIEFQDYWGSVDYWQTTFVGTYSGLLFTDEQGDHYSNEIGEVLKYLDFGVIIAGQTTIDHAIKLKNTYGYSVENVRITADESDFPDGMSAQFSKTQTPFQSEDVLVYDDVMDDGDEKTFYIRLATQLGVTSNAEGVFDISVKADQVTEDGS